MLIQTVDTCGLESFIHVQCPLHFSHNILLITNISELLNWTKDGLSHSLSLKSTCQCECFFVVTVCTILLLLFCFFIYVFCYETTTRDSVATLWNEWVLINVNVHVRPAQRCVYYTIHTLYAVPCIRLKKWSILWYLLIQKYNILTYSQHCHKECCELSW